MQNYRCSKADHTNSDNPKSFQKKPKKVKFRSTFFGYDKNQPYGGVKDQGVEGFGVGKISP